MNVVCLCLDIFIFILFYRDVGNSKINLRISENRDFRQMNSDRPRIFSEKLPPKNTLRI